MIRHKIKLPVKYNLDGSRYIDADKLYSERGFVPDWEYMSKYIKSLPLEIKFDNISTKYINDLAVQSAAPTIKIP